MKGPREGGRSPWGKIQSVKVRAIGDIWQVETAGHGGMKVSRRVQQRIPKASQRPGGWYEEDIEWSIIAVLFPAAFSQDEVNSAHQTMKSWLPDEYRNLTGHEVAADESLVMRERRDHAKYRGHWITIAAFGDWHERVPEGMVGVVATIGGRRGVKDERWFLTTEERYKSQKLSIGYVVDPSVDVEIAPLQ
jgi:hypothetical protein